MRASINAEGEQYIPGIADEATVAGVEIQHPSCDDRARSLEPTAFRLHAVDGRELAVGVESPQDLAVNGRVGAHAAVERPGEHRARNYRHRRALRRAARARLGAQLRL